MSPPDLLEITEFDEAGGLTSTYVQSPGPDSASGRVDVILPENAKPVWQRALDVFLPAGFPHSVTEDYVWYQIYDSLQAFSSAIAGLLASRAVLEGIGVGDTNASPTAALLLSILQDSTGRLATILFAYRLGTAIEPECKRYRLLADVFNDAAMVLDCLSPAFPRPIRVGVLSGSSVLRALCGVAANGSKACLSQHFARQGNVGELNAKDSSQETVISLLGMLAGSLVVQRVSSPLATWAALLFLLAIHLGTNYLAVRSVSMRSLNRQRANIVLNHLLQHDAVLRPQEVSRMERIFERDGVFRDEHDRVIGRCSIGSSMKGLLGCLGSQQQGQSTISGSFTTCGVDLRAVLDLFGREWYMLWPDSSSSRTIIVLKQGASARDGLKAWYHGLLLAKKTNAAAAADDKLYTKSNSQVCSTFDGFAERLTAAGWDLTDAALETKSGTRVRCGAAVQSSHRGQAGSREGGRGA
ncbi:DUF647-domain-containing protein [Rhizodiscina lignyota]|uniref:DUF647-domain-containing protein n=1 Tax=Rhizodiscina lignyota TaxID=1504668 RepID=A0A9P4IJY5_9PEZI|nr:DUF647-domain-containing protein [Rhizodiscina lignyota]